MSDSEEEKNPTTAEDAVVTKYKMASEIVTNTLAHLVKECVDGAKVITLCELGDKLMLDETAKIFKKDKEMKKGIAFPTCVSVNNTICYYSPLRSEATPLALKNGDVVKINIGAHVDGFPVVAGHTVVVGATSENKVTGRKADAILAAHYIAEACLRLLKADVENYDVTAMANRIADEFKCKPVEGIQCHTMERNKYHGEKSIVWNPTEEHRKSVEKCKLEKHDVWQVSVVVSTGEGRPRESEERTTVFKKGDNVYQLKGKTARLFFHEVNARFQTFPFTLRAWEDEKVARAGVLECRNHELVEPLNVYQERDGEFVAMFQYTLLLMPNSSMRIGSIPFDASLVHSEHKIEQADLKELLHNKSLGGKKKKKSKKASGSKDGGVGESSTAAANGQTPAPAVVA